MPKPLVTDQLWSVVEPLLAEEPPKPKGGRPRVPDRAALTSILFVLKTGIPWEMVPQEMGCGSAMTSAGAASRSGTSSAYGSACTERCSIAWDKRRRSTGSEPLWTRQRCRPLGGEKTGPNPTDRGKQGSKRHLVVDCQGVPLALKHSAANVHDSKMLEEEVVDAIGPVRGPQGRPGEGHASVPRSSTPTRARTSPGVGRHSASGASRVAHSQEGHRLQRAARASSMGGGADAFVAEALSAAGGALRAAG
jgi:transposase